MVRILLVSILVFSVNPLFGQLKSNQHVIGPSLGFSFLESTLQFGINHEYNIDTKQIGLGTNGIIGVGGLFRYWNYSEKFKDFQWDYTNILLGVQTNYHFYFYNDNIDPWIGVILAYDFGEANLKITNSTVNVLDQESGGLFVGASAGIRYWVSNNIGISAIIGIGSLRYGALEIGVDYQLN